MVPNNTTFSMRDVCDEMGLSYAGRTLTSLFSSANPNGFDPAYVGSKNSLLNFRNYDHTPVANFLTISPESQNFTYDGGTFTITVSSNISWTVDSSTWISTSPLSGSNNGSVFVEVSSNQASSNNRSGEIQIQGSGIVRLCSILQGGFCLIKGTKVRLYNNSLINIEDLLQGDLLFSEEIETFKDSNIPENLFKWSNKELKLRNKASSIKSIIEIKDQETININEGVLEATTKHNQLIRREGIWMFKPFGELKLGDFLYHKSGKLIEITSLNNNINTVYKLSLEAPYHTFYGNDILTHNIK